MNFVLSNLMNHKSNLCARMQTLKGQFLKHGITSTYFEVLLYFVGPRQILQTLRYFITKRLVRMQNLIEKRASSISQVRNYSLLTMNSFFADITTK